MRVQQVGVFIAFIGIFICFSALSFAVPPTHTISGVVATDAGAGDEILLDMTG